MRLRPRIFFTTLLLCPLAFADCPELLSNGDFETGDAAGWTYYPTDDFYFFRVEDDPYTPDNQFLEFDYMDYLDPPDVWNAGLQQRITLTDGATYRLTFWARGDDQYGNDDGSAPGQVTVAEDDSQSPANYGLNEDIVWEYNDGEGKGYEFEFVANTGGPAVLNFFFGLEAVIITIDSVSLQEISSSSCASSGGSGSGGGASGGASSGGASSGGSSSGGASSGGSSGNTGGVGGQIHNNQVSYVSTAEKVATLVSSSSSPLSWQLKNADGTVVKSGQTSVSGNDASSGHSTHLIDFSSYQEPGTGYRLWVGTAAGPTFAIGGDGYAELRRDALRFFYYQRASQAIASPYSEGSAYTRAAGHTDASISCTSSLECNYNLDARFGWYDAGDYGKYVVNGGISLWTLLNLYERTQHLGTDLSALGDNKNNIPESGNSVSDLLDEARTEIRFMLGMQVPEGQPLAGMVHHKTHSDGWDTIPVLPEDALPHFLRPPSTAATLNLAATLAQAARIYKSIDAPFSTQCLNAATAAYAAAQAHPAVYAPTDDDDGGGNYSDGDVSDEFYWAAAELYITTGEQEYLTDVFASEHHAHPPLGGAAMSWPTTATLGMISLATVPSDMDDAEVEAVRAALVLRAQEDLDMATSGYGTSIDEFFWGSNSSVLNASLVHAVAYDLTGETDYRAAALAGLDYVLGRNPLGQSYVSGYGAAPFKNAHHRTWAIGFNASWPAPPPGVLAGGPNQSLDGLSNADINELGLTDCSPSACWADYAPGFSLTEVTVNWNAPLAWLAAWASELENEPQNEFPGVDLDAKPGDGTTGGDGDGDATGDGDAASGDGDGDVTSGDGDATSGDGDATSGDGDATSGDGDATSGDGDATSGDGDGEGCDPGNEGCACYANDTCNDDLRCLSNLCVEDDEGGDGDDSGSAAGDKGGCSYDGKSSPSTPLGILGLLALAWFRRRRDIGVRSKTVGNTF